jgi:DNA recombination-dependent growth factor C
MGLLRGSASLSRYFVNGVPPENYLDEYSQTITRYSFKGFDESSDEERAVGWVNIMNIFETSFEQKNFYMYPYISLSFRADLRKVPSSALKQHCLEAEHKIKVMENLEYLSKEKRKDIKGTTLNQLLKRAIPRTNTYDMVWNIKTGMLLFGATGSKTCDEFAEIFFKTFGLNLSPVFPYSFARVNLEKLGQDTAALDSIRPFNIRGDRNGHS